MTVPSPASQPADKRISIICNPFAGRGKASKLATEAVKFCKQQQWQVNPPLHSEYAGQIENEFAAQVAQCSDMVILIGGDGTLRELIAGLRKSQIKPDIAFIPMGNANVVARELNIPLNPYKALKMLAHSHAIWVDIGILHQSDNKTNTHDALGTENTLIFLAMLEIGFGAKIVHLVNQLRLGRFSRLYQFWGDIVYAIAGLLAFMQQKSAKLKLSANNQQIESRHLVIANMKTYAKGWSLTPEADCQDKMLDIAYSTHNSKLGTLACFVAAARRKPSPASRMHYSRSMDSKIVGAPGAFMQVDGDPVPFNGQVQVAIEPAAFAIHIPKPG